MMSGGFSNFLPAAKNSVESFDVNLSKNEALKRYFRFIYSVTFVIVILGMLVGFFTAGVSLDEIDREWRLQTTRVLTYIWGGLLLLVLIFGLITARIRILFPWQFYYAYSLVFSVSWFISGHISPMLLIGFVFFLIYFNFLRCEIFDVALSSGLAYMLSIYHLIPVLMDSLGYYFPPPFYWFDGFRGMNFDRVEYAFFVGLAFLLIVVTDKRFGLRAWFFLIGLIYCAVLSQTRFLFPAVFLGLIIYFGMSAKLFFAAVILLVSVVVWSFFGVREDILVSGRSDLYIDYFSYVYNNLWIIIFGSSEFYQSYNYGDVPHNFVMQSILNWGLMGLCAYFLMIAKIFNKVDRGGKALMAYLFSFGLFHPGVDAYLVTPVVAFVFLSIIGVNCRRCEI